MIPKSFQILGHTVKVEHKEYVDFGANEGSSEHLKLKIEVAKKDTKGDIPLTVQEHTYFHELTHMILDNMGEGELSSNEKFVDTFSALLHQAIKTSKY
jgi:hypothetical protein